jgi:hypothetical protein
MLAKWARAKNVHSQSLTKFRRSLALLSFELNGRMPSNPCPTRRVISTTTRRLDEISKAFAPVLQPVGTLKLGDITYDVPASLSPSRLPRSRVPSLADGLREGPLLDVQDPVNLDHLHFLLQKYVLGQDVFLVSQPGPYARRLALTFARWVVC